MLAGSSRRVSLDALRAWIVKKAEEIMPSERRECSVMATTRPAVAPLLDTDINWEMAGAAPWPPSDPVLDAAIAALPLLDDSLGAAAVEQLAETLVDLRAKSARRVRGAVGGTRDAAYPDDHDSAPTGTSSRSPAGPAARLMDIDARRADVAARFASIKATREALESGQVPTVPIQVGYPDDELEDAVDVAQQGRDIAAAGVPYVWDGIIPAYGMLGFLVAFAKVGKTTLGQAIAAHIASGCSFLDRPTTAARVLDLAAEDPPEYTAYLARHLDVPRGRMFIGGNRSSSPGPTYRASAPPSPTTRSGSW